MYTAAYSAEAKWNDTLWKNPHFNELLISTRAELNETKRGEMYADIQNILHDGGEIMVLMFNSFVTTRSKKLAHGGLNSNYDHVGGYMYRRWLFA